jgi:hypothetical protein
MAESIKSSDVFEKQSFWKWFWEYFSLNKKQRDVSKAIRLANKMAKAYNKRFYVFYLSDKKYHILSRYQIDRAKKEGVFKKGLNYLDIINSAKHVTK